MLVPYLPRYRRVSHPRAEIEAHAEQHQQDLAREARNKRSDHEHEDDPIIAALCQPRKLKRNKTIIDVNYISGNCNFDLYIYTYKRGV